MNRDGRLFDQTQQLFAVGRGNVLIRDRRAAHPGAGLRLALERNALVERRHRLELHLGQTQTDALHELVVGARERLVVRGAGVPAIRAASFA